MATSRGCQRREYQNEFWNGCQRGGEKVDVLEKHGRSTSSHNNEKFRTRSMEKRRGMAFGLWERAIAVIEQDR
jgi:hypothetical protein